MYSTGDFLKRMMRVLLAAAPLCSRLALLPRTSHPVTLGLCSESDLNKAIAVSVKRVDK